MKYLIIFLLSWSAWADNPSNQYSIPTGTLFKGDKLKEYVGLEIKIPQGHWKKAKELRNNPYVQHLGELFCQAVIKHKKPCKPVAIIWEERG